MDKTKLYNLIYDRLANNTEADINMIYNPDNHEGLCISMTIDDKQYQLTLREVKDDLYIIND